MNLIQLYLLIYFPVFVFFCFFLRVILFWKKYGTFAVKSDFPTRLHAIIAHGLNGVGFVIGMILFIVILDPSKTQMLMPFVNLENTSVQAFGVLIQLLALIICVLAQAEMGKSWRIGVDTKVKTDLVAHGLYKWSRNPIYLSVICVVLGLFLIIPSIATLAALVAGLGLFRGQVYLEEQHMLSLHGDKFKEYCSRIRRWL